MSRTVKIVYFIAALAIMFCFAAGSVALASGRAGLAVALFSAAIVGTACGFILKRRFVDRP